jgi:TM2 domain-containing membrane protein YozV
LKNELLFKKIELLILNKNFNYAEIVINELKEKNEIQKKKKAFYYAVADFSLGKMNESQSLFLDCIDDSLKKEKTNITELFVKIKRNEAKNPKMPGVMSALIPGLGQFYSGDVKNGTKSLLLNASLITLSFVVAYNYTVFDAVISVVPWWLRYYRGGIYRAEKIAGSKKERVRNSLYNQVLQVISETKR